MVGENAEAGSGVSNMPTYDSHAPMIKRIYEPIDVTASALVLEDHIINEYQYLLQTYTHYQIGGGDDLVLDGARLTFLFETQDDLKLDDGSLLRALKLGESGRVSLLQNTLTVGPTGPGLLLGNVKFTRTGKNTFSLSTEPFNFDYQSGRSFARSLFTAVGWGAVNNLWAPLGPYKLLGMLTPQVFGGPFDIVVQGDVYVP